MSAVSPERPGAACNAASPIASSSNTTRNRSAWGSEARGGLAENLKQILNRAASMTADTTNLRQAIKLKPRSTSQTSMPSCNVRKCGRISEH